MNLMKITSTVLLLIVLVSESVQGGPPSRPPRGLRMPRAAGALSSEMNLGTKTFVDGTNVHEKSTSHVKGIEDRSNIEDRVIKIIVETLGVKKSMVTNEASLKSLGAYYC